MSQKETHLIRWTLMLRSQGARATMDDIVATVASTSKGLGRGISLSKAEAAADLLIGKWYTEGAFARPRREYPLLVESRRLREIEA